MDATAVLCPVAAGLAAGCSAFVLLGDAMGIAAVRRVPSLAKRLVPPSTGRTQRRKGMRATRRNASRDMPEFLDIVSLGLSAGLSFDASLELYGTRFDTELARMVCDALLSWRIGYRTRQEALLVLADELELPAMRRFALTVSEALSFGAPLTSALAQQAGVIRDEQRSSVEEEIERTPVKMLIPLGTLILPSMLLAILGPLLGPALGTA